jgi:hypothetical protein
MVNLDNKVLKDIPKDYSVAFVDKGSSGRIPLEMFGYSIKQQLWIEVCQLSTNETFEFIQKIHHNDHFHQFNGWYSSQAADAFRSFVIELITRYSKDIVEMKVLPFIARPPIAYDKTFFDLHWPQYEEYLAKENDSDEEDPPFTDKFPDIAIRLKWMKKFRQSVRDSDSTKSSSSSSSSSSAVINRPFSYLPKQKPTPSVMPAATATSSVASQKPTTEIKSFTFFQNDSDSEGSNF